MEAWVVEVNEALALLHGSDKYFGKSSFLQEYKDPAN